MTMIYTDRKREKDPHSLPNCEVFYADVGELQDENEMPLDAGWYFAFGSPGCLWDSDPEGPYDSESEATQAAREVAGDDDESEVE